MVVWRLSRDVDATPAAAAPGAGAGAGAGAGGRAAKPEDEVRPLPLYDLAAIDGDAEYYGAVDHRRFHQRAGLPKGVKRHPELRFAGEPLIYCSPGGRPEKLKVRAQPGRPVTFLGLDGGVFANGDNCVTVKADGAGVAEAAFAPAACRDYRIAVSSSENSGQIEFVVKSMTDQAIGELFGGEAAEKHKAKLEEAKRRWMQDETGPPSRSSSPPRPRPGRPHRTWRPPRRGSPASCC